MTPNAHLVLLVLSALCTAAGQVPVLGPFQPALATFGWALAAIAKAQDALASRALAAPPGPETPPPPPPPLAKP